MAATLETNKLSPLADLLMLRIGHHNLFVVRVRRRRVRIYEAGWFRTSRRVGEGLRGAVTAAAPFALNNLHLDEEDCLANRQAGRHTTHASRQAS